MSGIVGIRQKKDFLKNKAGTIFDLTEQPRVKIQKVSKSGEIRRTGGLLKRASQRRECQGYGAVCH